jgi:hypothetical protein
MKVEVLGGIPIYGFECHVVGEEAHRTGKYMASLKFFSGSAASLRWSRR